MKSSIEKRSLVIRGRKSSISLEKEFFEALLEIAKVQEKSVADIVSEIDEQRETANLSSAVRLFVLTYFQANLDSS